tara:strand:- start:3227 stop:3406 length:180 start_codon:yes stop_codon:yes gene_type:complete
MSSKYRIGVWDLTYYKIDEETNEPLRNDKGNVQIFRTDEDFSLIADGIDEDRLEEVDDE